MTHGTKSPFLKNKQMRLQKTKCRFRSLYEWNAVGHKIHEIHIRGTFQRTGWHASTNQSFPSKGHMKIIWPAMTYLPCVNLLFGGSYLCAFDANDAVQTTGWIIEERDADGGTGSRNPRTLRLRINMEHVRLAREDRLLTANTQIIPINYYNFELLLVTESRLVSIQSE